MQFRSFDAYRHYECSVLNNRRYLYDETVRDFLHSVQETSSSRTLFLPAGTVLWRAQRGHDYRLENKGQPDEMEVPTAFAPQRMKPISNEAPDGRVNPRGIAYLYLALDASTACSEVRPWIGSYISLGRFQTTRDLRIVDFTSDERMALPFKSLDATDADNPVITPWGPEDYDHVVWGHIGYAMSKPVTREDSSLDYVPTQIIAESLRDYGANGLIYKSLLGKGGVNIALFGLQDADIIDRRLMETATFQCTFKQIEGPCVVYAQETTAVQQ